tara:strand:- start:1447 stop:2718 length:1272 start_codon:yes stop_codon:yes gene_type:complete
MATINFLYRSKRNAASLNLRLLFRHNNKDYVVGGKTKVEVLKDYWFNKYNSNSKDIEIQNMQLELKTELNSIQNHILQSFNKTNPEVINKFWLQSRIDEYYNPPQQLSELPKELLKYFDVYLDNKRSEIKNSSVKKYSVLKKLIIRYESELKNPLLIKSIGLNFKRDFENYCKKHQYSTNTISKALRTIKSVCKDASYNGLETHFQLERIRTPFVKTESIYLTFKELSKIEKIKKNKLSKNLDDARDWLIISCYTGQRISDFMRFNEKQIRVEKGKSLIEFTQQKTNKNMTIPLHGKVLEILKKRDGKFPDGITTDKYNNYIKDVCQIAGINEKINSKKSTKVEDNGAKTMKSRYSYRKLEGLFEKWELVTSHIGRRSFATNFYGEIPTSYLIYVTGHSTEIMFLNYIGKSNKDLAMELTKYF